MVTERGDKCLMLSKCNTIFDRTYNYVLCSGQSFPDLYKSYVLLVRYKGCRDVYANHAPYKIE